MNWWQVTPVLVFSLLVITSLLNPSHEPDINHHGRWLPREAWISWLPSTVDRQATIKGMMPWVSALLLFGAIKRASFSRKGARLVWAAILIHGGIVALVGIYFHVTAPYEILGFLKDRHGYHFASFVYRNHWAAAVIVMVPIALGFAFSAIGKWKRDRGHFDAVLPGFGIALLLVLTLPIPGSRSGLLICSGVLVFALIRLAFDVVRSRQTTNNRGKFLATSAFLVFILVTGSAGIAMTKGRLVEHLKRTQQQLEGIKKGNSDLRILLTRDTLRMAADRPIWGWGVGTLGIVFPQYQGNYLRDKEGKVSSRVVHSHNDWAQISAETGVIGLILFLWLLWLPIRQGWKSNSVLEKWVTGGLFIVLAYALVDFPLHNPAVLLMVATLLGTLGTGNDTKVSLAQNRPKRTHLK